MIIVKGTLRAAGVVRGDHIAAALGVPCYFNDLRGCQRNTVVFVKKAFPRLVKEAKARDNTVVYDILDNFCYKPRDLPEDAEVVIVPNDKAAQFYRNIFLSARFVIIPHQWDYRITRAAPQDEFRPGYVGSTFNLTADFPVERVTDEDQWLTALPRFNLHISAHKRDHAAILKPATKVANAAAVGANIVTYPDPSVTELLGVDYPYYIGDDPMAAFEHARETFGTDVWEYGLAKMGAVKERTSLANVARCYKELQ